MTTREFFLLCTLLTMFCVCLMSGDLVTQADYIHHIETRIGGRVVYSEDTTNPGYVRISTRYGYTPTGLCIIRTTETNFYWK